MPGPASSPASPDHRSLQCTQKRTCGVPATAVSPGVPSSAATVTQPLPVLFGLFSSHIGGRVSLSSSTSLYGQPPRAPRCYMDVCVCMYLGMYACVCGRRASDTLLVGAACLRAWQRLGEGVQPSSPKFSYILVPPFFPFRNSAGFPCRLPCAMLTILFPMGFKEQDRQRRAWRAGVCHRNMSCCIANGCGGRLQVGRA